MESIQFWHQLREQGVHLITRLKKRASIRVEQVFSDSYGWRDRVVILGSGTKKTPFSRFCNPEASMAIAQLIELIPSKGARIFGNLQAAQDHLPSGYPNTLVNGIVEGGVALHSVSVIARVRRPVIAERAAYCSQSANRSKTKLQYLHLADQQLGNFG